jgi:hypothetical protein
MMRAVSNRNRATLASGALLLALGCGDARDATPPAAPRLEQRVWMSAADGGEISLEDGASLRMPAGALAADGDVTFTREACGGVFASDHFRSCLYQVAAASALSQPFSLQLPPLREASDGPPSCISRQSASGWPCLADESSSSDAPGVEATSDDRHVAKASAFSFFAARAAATVVVDGRVADVPFERCGGPLEGRWEMVATTATANRFYHYWRDPDPFAVCGPAERYEDRPFSSTQTLQFSTSAVSVPEDQPSLDEEAFGSVSSSESHDIVHYSITTMSCMRRAGERCDDGCVRDGDVCECVVPQGRGAAGWNSTWSLPEPGSIQLGSSSHRYCVEGDRLTIEFDEEIDGPYVQVYERRR